MIEDTVETLLLRKAGESRRAIEAIDKKVNSLSNRMAKLETRFNAIMLEMEAIIGTTEDREAYLKGEIEIEER